MMDIFPFPETERDDRCTDRPFRVIGDRMEMKSLSEFLPSPPCETDQPTSQEDHRARLESVYPDPRSAFQGFP